MAGLSTRQTVQVNRTRVPLRPSRRSAVPQASLREAADWFAAGFLKIFTPPTDSGVNWKGTSGGYSGVVNRRHASKYPEPVAQQDKAASEQTFAMDKDVIEVKEEQTSTGPEFAEYIAGALQRLMGHNFKGDATEPDWDGTASGWTGSIRQKRKQDGFHSKKL